MYSLSFIGFFKQYGIKNIWSPQGIEPRTACITHKRSATERDRIHIMSKRRLRMKLWHNNNKNNNNNNNNLTVVTTASYNNFFKVMKLNNCKWDIYSIKTLACWHLLLTSCSVNYITKRRQWVLVNVTYCCCCLCFRYYRIQCI